MPRTTFFVNVIHQILRLALLLAITGAAAAVAGTASERLDIDRSGTLKRTELRSHVRKLACFVWFAFSSGFQNDGQSRA